MHLNQYAISLSFQRHLSPYINHPAIISLINFYIHSSFNSQTPLISPDKTRKSVFIPFLYKFISFSYRSINHPHNNNFPLLTIPIQQNSLQKKSREKQIQMSFPRVFDTIIYQFPSEKRGLDHPRHSVSISGNTDPIPCILCASHQPPYHPPLLFSLSQQIWSEGRIGSIRSRNLALFDIGTHVRATLRCAA